MTLKGFHSLREIYRGAGSTIFRAVPASFRQPREAHGYAMNTK